MTTPKILTFKGKDEAQMYACGACGKCYSPNVYACAHGEGLTHAFKAAEKCCVEPTCQDCGVIISKPWVACGECREIRKLRGATIVDLAGYSGPVHTDEVGVGGWGEGYYESIFELLEVCDDEGLTPPAYVHTCQADHLRIDAENILEHATSDMHEEAYDQIVDSDALFDFVEEWNAKQTSVCYHPRWRNIIVLDKDRFAAMLETQPHAA